MDRLVELTDKALAEDGDHMVATGDSLVWLLAQIACWPTRVDPEKTTNDRFLRLSAVATIKSLLARIEAAEKVLEPFIRAHRAFGDEDGPIGFYTYTGYREIALDDFRAAAQWQAGREGEA